jgi:hypothetical protein
VVGDQGNIYGAGSFAGTVDFDPSAGIDEHTSLGIDDIYLTIIGPAGNYINSLTWGSAYWDQPKDMTVDANHNIAIAGYFFSTADFDPGPGVHELVSNGDEDAFVTLLDPAGGFLWANSWGGSSRDWSYGVGFNQDGKVFVSGYFNSTVDFYPGPCIEEHTANNCEDIFLVKFWPGGIWE